MNKYVKEVIKIALVGGALASAVTGCCMWKSDKCGCHCGRPACTCCCKTDGVRARDCDGAKNHGVNTSVTLGVGTDGIKAETNSNVGSRGMSANADATVRDGGMSAGAGGQVR